MLAGTLPCPDVGVASYHTRSVQVFPASERWHLPWLQRQASKVQRCTRARCVEQHPATRVRLRIMFNTHTHARARTRTRVRCVRRETPVQRSVGTVWAYAPPSCRPLQDIRIAAMFWCVRIVHLGGRMAVSTRKHSWCSCRCAVWCCVVWHRRWSLQLVGSSRELF